MCEGVCEAPTFTEWSTMMVPTYPEDGSRALNKHFTTLNIKGLWTYYVGKNKKALIADRN